MCNLYNLKVGRWELLSYYGTQDAWREDMAKDYVSPGRSGVVITATASGRELHGMRWGFLTCGYDGDASSHVVGGIHPKAIPVILHDEDYDRWLTAPVEDALSVACAYPSQLMAVA